MRLKQANREFLSGYFSTHQRGAKTRAAYASDLAQFVEFTGKSRELQSLDGTAIERWAAYLRQRGHAPASMRRKLVVLKVFCSYWVRRGAPAHPPASPACRRALWGARRHPERPPSGRGVLPGHTAPH